MNNMKDKNKIKIGEYTFILPEIDLDYVESTSISTVLDNLIRGIHMFLKYQRGDSLVELENMHNMYNADGRVLPIIKKVNDCMFKLIDFREYYENLLFDYLNSVDLYIKNVHITNDFDIMFDGTVSENSGMGYVVPKTYLNNLIFMYYVHRDDGRLKSDILRIFDMGIGHYF